MSKEKILEEFDKTFDVSPFYSKHISEPVREYNKVVRKFIEKAIDQTREETIREVENGLPPTRTALYATGEFPATAETKLSIRYQEGLNEGEKRYRDKIKQSLKSLINK